MTGNDIINEAKSFYPVDLFLGIDILVNFVNQARERVNRLARLAWGEYYFQTTKDVSDYYLDKNFYSIDRVQCSLGNGIKIGLRRISTGDFMFEDNGITCYPLMYSFIPMNRIILYPTPSDIYEIYLYGNTTLGFNYTVNNLGENDGIIPDQFLAPLGIEVARRIAMFDQQYELARYLDEEFLMKMKEVKL